MKPARRRAAFFGSGSCVPASPLHGRARVHEAIQHQGRSLRLEKPAITHRSIKTVYTDRNLRIYQAQAAAGEPFSPRDSFYYGRELYYHKRYQEAIKVLEDFLRSGRGWVENNVEACKILSYCYEGLEDDMGAFGALTSSFFFTPPGRSSAVNWAGFL